MFQKVEKIKNDSFSGKGYSRIFILEKDKQAIDTILNILRTSDIEEFDGYFPSNIEPNDYVAIWDEEGRNELLYTHKFAIDDVEKFIKTCKEFGVDVLVKFQYDHYKTDELVYV